MLTGKYDLNDPASLPGGPRGLLFRRVLPGLAPLLDLMRQIAAARNKTLSQVAVNWCICQVTAGAQRRAGSPGRGAAGVATEGAAAPVRRAAGSATRLPPPPPPVQGTVPIPGAKDLVQAQENLGALGWWLRCGAGPCCDRGDTAAWAPSAPRSSALPTPPSRRRPCSDGEVRALNEAADRVPRGMQQNIFATK